MYNLIYDGRKVAKFVRTFSGPVWVTGYKEDGDTVHVCGDWMHSKNKQLIGPVWVLFHNGEYVSEYSANLRLIKMSVAETGFTDTDCVVYAGRDSGDMLFLIPDTTGLKGAKVVDDRFRLMTRKKLTTDALLLFGRVCYGDDFVHKRRGDLFGYPKFLQSKDGDWIVWVKDLRTFRTLHGAPVTVVFKVSADGRVTSDEGAIVVPTGIDEGTWCFKVPEDALDYPVYVTKEDAEPTELGLRGSVTEEVLLKLESDTYSLVTDTAAWCDMLTLLQDIQEHIPDDRKHEDNYVLYGTLEYLFDLLAHGKE